MSEPPEKTILSGGAGLGNVADGDEAYCAACGDSFPIDRDVCPKDGSRLTKLKARPDSLLGRVFDGRYEVRATLGQGGMGTVYRGWQISVDREVAIKVIHPKLASDRVAVKRFLREVRLASRLSQPNIVNVYDSGQTEDGVLYLVMELLRGKPLSDELRGMRPVPLHRVETIALQLCDALDVAHAQGIIHRDLKPGNIVILDDPPGRDLVKVLDFGLAKSLVADTSSVVTNSSTLLGTPLYMAPEQIEGVPADQRADLYSLGCILHHLVSGRPPFIAETVNQVLAMHLNDPPPPPPASVPASLAKAIAQLLAKRPDDRIASAALLRTALERVFDAGAPAAAPAPSGTVAQPHPALAVTDPAAVAVAAAHRDRAAAVSTPTGLGALAPPRRRWLPLAIAGSALVPVGLVVGLAMRSGDRPTGASPDASHAIVDVADAPMQPAAPPVNAASPPPPVDAATPPADAGKPKRRTPPPLQRDAGPTTTPPPPAPPPPPPPASRDAGLPFIGLDGGT